MLALFFSLNGRISRRAYFLGSLFLLVLGCGSWLLEPLSEAQRAYSLGYMLVSLWCGSLALPVKRLHDLNVTGLVAPVIYWVPSFFVVVGFIISLYALDVGVSADGASQLDEDGLGVTSFQTVTVVSEPASIWDEVVFYWTMLKASTVGLVVAGAGALATVLGWLCLCLVPGKPGPNRFGESPLVG